MNYLKIKGILVASFLLVTLTCANAQEWSFGLSGGYDLPIVDHQFPLYEVDGGIGLGLRMSYNWSNWGIGLDYDFIRNSPHSLLGTSFFTDSSMVTEIGVNSQDVDISRHSVGIGPNYTFIPFSNWHMTVFGRFGYAWINGGDISQSEIVAPTNYHMVFGGFSNGVVSAKAGLKIEYRLNSQLGLTLGAYYSYHHQVSPDYNIEGLGPQDFVYGQTDFEQGDLGYYNSQGDALVVPEDNCIGYSSIGINLGLKYAFGYSRSKNEDHSIGGANSHKLIVTVKDELSGVVIPDADVVLKDRVGNVVATAVTNSYGLVDFGFIEPGRYSIAGQIMSVETSVEHVHEMEFKEGESINKTIYYQDLRFLLKGVTTNKATGSPEPQVLVSLSNNTGGGVNQSASDGKGQFMFHLDKNSSYEVVGIKENRLSDIEQVSTIGLTRSATLFVDLSLGMDNFNCGRGTVLDIKYEFDSDQLLTESRYELDRLIRYMNDHQVSRVELSSHTDSRGPAEYNQDLSQRRAQSAVNYIISRGISRNRIIASGYGEERLKNNCADGVNCSEEQHRINRRTEASLLCK